LFLSITGPLAGCSGDNDPAAPPGLPPPTGTLPSQVEANSAIMQSAPTGTAVPTPPSVLVKDENGNPMAGVAVSFAVAGGGTVFPTIPVMTNASGIAAVSKWSLGPNQGENILTARAAGSDIAGNPVRFGAAGLAFSQQGPKLVGTGAVGPARQGYSASLSADGNTAVVGGPTDDNGAGAAWIWTRNGGAWTQQGAKLVGTGAAANAGQGISVSLSADGNTAIVGAQYDNSIASGAAWVWTRSGGVWTQQGAGLVLTGTSGSGSAPTSVSLSADGNTAIIGWPVDDDGAGAAWIWTRDGGVWMQQGGKLVGIGASGTAFAGTSVSLSADGNTAIVGGYRDNASLGAAWVWTRSGGVWTQQGAKLVGTGAVGTAYQGSSVSLSADGNTAIVGGYRDNSYVGAAWVWTRGAGVWTQQGVKLVGTGVSVGTLASQGISVSLSADGNTAIVGGYTDGYSAGAAWIWLRQAGLWTPWGPKLLGTDGGGTAHQGFSVSLSGEGHTALVGGYADNADAGAGWIFTVQ